MTHILRIDEYAYEDGRHGQCEYYYLPEFMWRDKRNGYTESEMASHFVEIYDGVKDARIMPDDKLRLSAQYDGMMEIVSDLDLWNDDYMKQETTSYMGKEPDTEEEVIEYLKNNK